MSDLLFYGSSKYRTVRGLYIGAKSGYCMLSDDSIMPLLPSNVKQRLQSYSFDQNDLMIVGDFPGNEWIIGEEFELFWKNKLSGCQKICVMGNFGSDVFEHFIFHIHADRLSFTHFYCGVEYWRWMEKNVKELTLVLMGTKFIDVLTSFDRNQIKFNKLQIFFDTAAPTHYELMSCLQKVVATNNSEVLLYFRCENQNLQECISSNRNFCQIKDHLLADPFNSSTCLLGTRKENLRYFMFHHRFENLKLGFLNTEQTSKKPERFLDENLENEIVDYDFVYDRQFYEEFDEVTSLNDSCCSKYEIPMKYDNISKPGCCLMYSLPSNNRDCDFPSFVDASISAIDYFPIYVNCLTDNGLFITPDHPVVFTTFLYNKIASSNFTLSSSYILSHISSNGFRPFLRSIQEIHLRGKCFHKTLFPIFTLPPISSIVANDFYFRSTSLICLFKQLAIGNLNNLRNITVDARDTVNHSLSSCKFVLVNSQRPHTLYGRNMQSLTLFADQCFEVNADFAAKHIYEIIQFSGQLTARGAVVTIFSNDYFDNEEFLQQMGKWIRFIGSKEVLIPKFYSSRRNNGPCSAVGIVLQFEYEDNYEKKYFILTPKRNEDDQNLAYGLLKYKIDKVHQQIQQHQQPYQNATQPFVHQHRYFQQQENHYQPRQQDSFQQNYQQQQPIMQPAYFPHLPQEQRTPRFAQQQFGPAPTGFQLAFIPRPEGFYENAEEDGPKNG